MTRSYKSALPKEREREKGRKYSSMTTSTPHYRTVGDIVHYAFIGLTVWLTTAVMLAAASDDQGSFDPLWITKGFCVTPRHHNSNNANVRGGFLSTLSLDTEIVCCLLLVASALANHYFFCYEWSSSSSTKPTKSTAGSLNPLLEMRLKSGVFANAAHGLGHLFVYLSPGPPPALSLDLWDAMAIGNIVMLLAFWVVALSIQDYWTALYMATVILSAQCILDVPPYLSFTYSQSVIFLIASIDQLVLANSREKQQAKNSHNNDDNDDTDFIYAVIAVTFLPLMALFPLEYAYCTDVLAPWGGHAVYDAYLSALPFILYFTTEALVSLQCPLTNLRKHRALRRISPKYRKTDRKFTSQISSNGTAHTAERWW